MEPISRENKHDPTDNIYLLRKFSFGDKQWYSDISTENQKLTWNWIETPETKTSDIQINMQIQIPPNPTKLNQNHKTKKTNPRSDQKLRKFSITAKSKPTRENKYHLARIKPPSKSEISPPIQQLKNRKIPKQALLPRHSLSLSLSLSLPRHFCL